MSLIINLLLFFIPLTVFPFGNSQFEIPKVIFTIVLVSLLLSIVWLKKGAGFFRSFHPVLLWLCGLIFLLSVYHLVFHYSSLMFWGNQFRMQGVFLLWVLMGFALLTSIIPYRRLHFYWYFGVLIVSLTASLFLGNDNSRSIGTLGEPNALAAFMVFLWPFILMYKNSKVKYISFLKVVSFLMVIFVIFLSGSRSGAAALIIQLLFLLSFKISRSLKFSLILALVLVGTVFFLPKFEQAKYENRSVIWHTAFEAGLQNPRFGGGFGNTEIILRKVIVREHNSLIGYYVDSSHNIFLDWWVQGGIAGVGLLTVVLFYVTKNFYKGKQVLYLVLFLGLITALLLNPASAVSMVHLWWLIGQGFTGKTRTDLMV